MRIIAGTARGRSFEAPPGMDTRPTLDRVKEAMFGAIQFDIPDSRVLDLFSGSGNLGLESASRGAGRVVCNDRARVCAEGIRRNAALLGLSERVEVLSLDYAAAIDRLAEAGERFDIAFIDAPYADSTAQDAAKRLFARGLIAPHGYVILEHAWDRRPAATDEYGIAWQRKYGKCGVSKLEGVRAE